MSVAMATKANTAPVSLLRSVEYLQLEKAPVGLERATLLLWRHNRQQHRECVSERVSKPTRGSSPLFQEQHAQTLVFNFTNRPKWQVFQNAALVFSRRRAVPDVDNLVVAKVVTGCFLSSHP